MGFLDRLFRRRGGGSDAPAPTRDDTLSSTYVPPPTPDVQPAEGSEEQVEEEADGGDAGDAGEGDGGGDGGGNGGGNGDGGGD